MRPESDSPRARRASLQTSEQGTPSPRRYGRCLAASPPRRLVVKTSKYLTCTRRFSSPHSRFMVVYPFWAARLLHVAPLAFHLAFFASARRALVDVLAAVALSLALPSFVGASRAFVSGQPLSWSVLDFGAVTAQSMRRCSHPLQPDRILPDPFSISHARAGMAVSQRCGVDFIADGNACTPELDVHDARSDTLTRPSELPSQESPSRHPRHHSFS